MYTDSTHILSVFECVQAASLVIRREEYYLRDQAHTLDGIDENCHKIPFLESISDRSRILRNEITFISSSCSILQFTIFTTCISKFETLQMNLY